MKSSEKNTVQDFEAVKIRVCRGLAHRWEFDLEMDSIRTFWCPRVSFRIAVNLDFLCWHAASLKAEFEANFLVLKCERFKLQGDSIPTIATKMGAGGEAPPLTQRMSDRNIADADSTIELYRDMSVNEMSLHQSLTSLTKKSLMDVTASTGPMTLFLPRFD